MLGPILVHWLGDALAESRALAVIGLGKLGPAAAPALDEVRKAAQDGNPVVRCYAALALWKIEGRPDNALNVLISELVGKYEDARALTALLLGRMGPDASTALPALCQAVQDPSPDTRAQALFALGRIGAAAATCVPVLCAALREPKNSETTNEPNFDVRMDGYDKRPGPRSVQSFAAIALGQIGRGNNYALAALMAFRRATGMWTSDRQAADEALRLIAR